MCKYRNSVAMPLYMDMFTGVVSLYSCRVYGEPFYIGLIVPFIVIYLFNWVIYIIILCTLVCKNCQRKGDAAVRKTVKQNLLAAAMLSVLFGLGWGIGLAATAGITNAGVRDFFSALFIICTAFQGVMIFCLQTIRSKEVRKMWSRWFYRATGKNISDFITSVAGDRQRHISQMSQPTYESSTQRKISATSALSGVYESATLQRSVKFSSEMQSYALTSLNEEDEKLKEKQPSLLLTPDEGQQEPFKAPSVEIKTSEFSEPGEETTVAIETSTEQPTQEAFQDEQNEQSSITGEIDATIEHSLEPSNEEKCGEVDKTQLDLSAGSLIKNGHKRETKKPAEIRPASVEILTKMDSSNTELDSALHSEEKEVVDSLPP